MTDRKTYVLGNIKKLVDLNGDTKNFDLTFTARSQDGSTFYALVIDQATLDNSTELEYKEAPGEISANIISDKNVYQNYLLVLKAKDGNACKVDVTIDKKEILPNVVDNNSSFNIETRKMQGEMNHNQSHSLRNGSIGGVDHQQPQHHQQYKQPQQPRGVYNDGPSSSGNGSNMNKLLLGIVIIGAVFVIYLYLSKKSSRSIVGTGGGGGSCNIGGGVLDNLGGGGGVGGTAFPSLIDRMNGIF